jgi:TRAP-type C4-dicarboxylate transport system permease small subunit
MRRLVDFLAILTGWALLAYCFMVGFEIVGRRYFGFSLQGVDEIGGYLMAALTATGLSFALHGGAHVRIDLLLRRLPTRVAMWLNVASMLSLLGFALFFLGRAWVVLDQSYSMWAVSPTPLRVPLIYPQAVWAAAILLFAVAAFMLTFRALQHALRGDAVAVAELAGSSTTSLTRN